MLRLDTSIRHRSRAAAGAAVLACLAASTAAARETRVAQLPSYSAAGTHQCGSSNRCIVSGHFMNCSDAAITLRTRDCCPTTKRGGTSTGFALNYCIADILRP